MKKVTQASSSPKTFIQLFVFSLFLSWWSCLDSCISTRLAKKANTMRGQTIMQPKIFILRYVCSIWYYHNSMGEYLLKKIFFFSFFFFFFFLIINVNCLGLFSSKIFNPTKIFVLSLFKMVANQTGCSRLKLKVYHLKSANHVKFSKECMMCMEKQLFVLKKMLINELDIGLPPQAQIKKKVH